MQNVIILMLLKSHTLQKKATSPKVFTVNCPLAVAAVKLCQQSQYLSDTANGTEDKAEMLFAPLSSLVHCRLTCDSAQHATVTRQQACYQKGLKQKHLPLKLHLVFHNKKLNKLLFASWELYSKGQNPHIVDIITENKGLLEVVLFLEQGFCIFT